MCYLNRLNHESATFLHEVRSQIGNFAEFNNIIPPINLCGTFRLKMPLAELTLDSS